MKIKDLGEKALLDLAKDICDTGHPVSVGVGDDAAVLEINEDSLIVTTDMLVEDIHFTREMTPEQIGRKAVVVNISDLAAMGADPMAMVFSIGSSGEEEEEFISSLFKSMNSTAKSYGSYVVGGDLNESEELIISGTALGKTPKNKILLRSGAKPGDFIGVTGDLGSAGAALETFRKNIPLRDKKPLRKALFEPQARIEEGKILSDSKAVSSAIDITDGLASDLWEISKMSGVKLTIKSGSIPVNETVKEVAEDYESNFEDFALFGGEDFELLFTVAPEGWDDLKNKFGKIGAKVTKIGEVTSGQGVFVQSDGEAKSLPEKGFEHYRHG